MLREREVFYAHTKHGICFPFVHLNGNLLPVYLGDCIPHIMFLLHTLKTEYVLGYALVGHICGYI